MTVAEADAPVAPSGPQLGDRPAPAAGPNPVLIVLVSFAVGALVAKIVDRRSRRG